MTVPSERTRAVQHTRDFLRRLLDRRETPRVPKEIRKEAYWCLRHYPGNMDLATSHERIPEIWGKACDDDESTD